VYKRGASEAPHYLRNGYRNFFMRFSPNGRVSEWDFKNVKLMTVFQREIKMAAINRK
jgi:hypothetical protein